MEENALFNVSLKIILKNHEGAILLLKVPPTSAMAGYCDLPGGRIRQGEEKEALRNIITREIQEEIGDITYELNEMPVVVSRHFYISKKTQKEQSLFWVLFEAKYLKGAIKLSDEHAEYQWIHLTTENINQYFTKGALEGMWSYLHKKFVDSQMMEKIWE